jgi:pectinesterase
VAFLNTEMSEVVRPAGWDNWRNPAREKTARYAEFNSTGPGANPQSRVTWAHQLTENQAKAITVDKVLGGSDGWDPQSILGQFPAKNPVPAATNNVPTAKP